MKSLRNLKLFLDVGCNYTSGAIRTKRSMAYFRVTVLDELCYLEKQMGTRIPSHRANYLRSYRERLMEMVAHYEKQQLENQQTKHDIAAP